MAKYHLCVSIKYLYTAFMISDIYNDAYYGITSVICQYKRVCNKQYYESIVILMYCGLVTPYGDIDLGQH